MEVGEIDEKTDRLVKARWLAIGLSQADLAEVLGEAFQQPWSGRNGTDASNAGRLRLVADALDIPLDAPDRRQAEHDTASLAPADASGAEQTLLGLRLLRAFRELCDSRTKRLVVHLAEQLVKRQSHHCEDPD